MENWFYPEVGHLLNWRSFSFYPVPEHLVCFLSFTLHLCSEIRLNICMFNSDKRHKGSFISKSLWTLFGPTSKTLTFLLSLFLARTRALRDALWRLLKAFMHLIGCNPGYNCAFMRSSHFSTPDYYYFHFGQNFHLATTLKFRKI